MQILTLDYRQTSFETGTRCAFQIAKLVAKGLSNINDKIIKYPIDMGALRTCVLYKSHDTAFREVLMEEDWKLFNG